MRRVLLSDWARDRYGQTGILTLVGLLMGITACADQSERSSQTTQDPSADDPCDAAFARAAAVDPLRDTHEDLFPAYSACEDLAAWREADRRHPDAIDGVDPVRYAMTVCANNQDRLGQTPICLAVDEPSPPTTNSLTSSGEEGLLGVALPEGSNLIDSRPGDPASGVDPMERYGVDATAEQIVDFLDRSLPAAGWAKDGSSMENALFFQRSGAMLGVLVNADGGTFSLMGS